MVIVPSKQCFIYCKCFPFEGMLGKNLCGKIRISHECESTVPSCENGVLSKGRLHFENNCMNQGVTYSKLAAYNCWKAVIFEVHEISVQKGLMGTTVYYMYSRERGPYDPVNPFRLLAWSWS